MNRIPNAQLTHVGLSVRDMDAMMAFYQHLLGLVVTDSGDLRGNRITFLSRDAEEHHQLVLISGRPADATYSPVTQISFRVDTLEDLQHFHRAAAALDVRQLTPSDHGNAWSIYFLDPEGNRVEVYAASPWYVHQPRQAPLDLTADADAIRAATHAGISRDDSYQPAQAWSTALRQRLAGGATPAPSSLPEGPR